MASKNKDNEVVVIKKYANRRLYNTQTSSYVTLDDLCGMVKKGEQFTVHDAKTNEDLTRQILAQIIFEQESKGQHLLPVNFLRSVISFYGNKMEEFLPHYLEASMETFNRNQDTMREYVGKSIEASPFTQFEEIGRQNMALFQKAFQMFTPFSNYAEGEEKPRKAAGGAKK